MRFGSVTTAAVWSVVCTAIQGPKPTLSPAVTVGWESRRISSRYARDSRRANATAGMTAGQLGSARKSGKGCAGTLGGIIPAGTRETLYLRNGDGGGIIVKRWDVSCLL